MTVQAGGGESQRIRIYTKPGCHLCVELVEMITALPDADTITVEEVNIELDEALFAQYRESIPVLELSDGSQLFPPHTEASIAAALHRVN